MDDKAGILEAIAKLIVLILSIFAEAQYLFVTVMVLIWLDQIAGTTRALVKKQFNWRKFNKVFVKILVYLTVIMATFVYEKFLIQNTSLVFTKGISGLIGFRELASIYNNASQAIGIDLFTTLIQKFKP